MPRSLFFTNKAAIIPRPSKLKEIPMFGLGTMELVIILVIVLVIFGAGKLPQVGSALGKGIKNFKEGMKDGETDVKTEVKAEKPIEVEKKKDV